MIARSFDGVPEGLTRDDVLDNVTHYWLTNTAVSSGRLYGQYKGPATSTSKMSKSLLPSASSLTRFIYAAKLGGAGVSQTHILQQARQRRALCSLGTATTLFRRDSCGLKITADIRERRMF